MSSPKEPQPAAASEPAAAARATLELIIRGLLVRAVFVACRLKIPDLLGDGAMSAEEVARATGAQSATVRRLLRALTGLDLLSGDGDRFAFDGAWAVVEI